MMCKRCGHERIVSEYADGSRFYACECGWDDMNPSDPNFLGGIKID